MIKTNGGGENSMIPCRPFMVLVKQMLISVGMWEGIDTRHIEESYVVDVQQEDRKKSYEWSEFPFLQEASIASRLGVSFCSLT